MTFAGGEVVSCAWSTGPQSNRRRRRGLNYNTSLQRTAAPNSASPR